MKFFKGSCIDVGTEQCPCALALTGDCLVCSRLQGKDCTDCDWKGVCIWNELRQNGGKVRGARKDFPAPLLQKEELGEGERALTILTLSVPRGLAQRAALPGSFVFLRRKEDALWYNVPLSVLQADPEQGRILLAVKVLSAKTKALLQEEESFLVRGVYRSGIQGAETLLQLRKSSAAPKNDAVQGEESLPRVLFLTRGVGLAPGCLAARFLEGRARRDFLVDDETVSRSFTGRFLEGACESLRFVRFGQDAVLPQTVSPNYDAVVLLVSDYYQECLLPQIRERFPDAALCLANNFRMCCGEGLCGACSYRTESGEILKMCKCTTVF